MRSRSVSVLVLCAHGRRSSSRNKGGVPQDLVSCKLAGWDRARQFRFQAQCGGQSCPTARSGSGSAEEMGCSGDGASSLGGCGEDGADQVLDSSLPGGREVCPGRCLAVATADQRPVSSEGLGAAGPGRGPSGQNSLATVTPGAVSSWALDLLRGSRSAQTCSRQDPAPRPRPALRPRAPVACARAPSACRRCQNQRPLGLTWDLHFISQTAVPVKEKMEKRNRMSQGSR